jgi:hypothetical protein
MSERALDRAAERASQSPFFLGFALARYARIEGLRDDAELARRLACHPATLSRLRLCRRPDGGSARFAADVLRIAQRFGLDPARLAELLRQVDALDALRAVEDTAGSWLAAARDRDEDEDDEDAEGEDPAP